MTREEKAKAIKCLRWFSEYNEEEYCGGDRIQNEDGKWFYYIDERDFKLFGMMIEWLEQEPQTDRNCISRTELLKHTHIEYDDDGVGHRVVYVEDIESLPSVNWKEPQPTTTTQQITESNQQITKSLQDSLKAGGNNATMLNYELSAIDRRLADISVTLAMIADRLGGER